MTLAEPLREKLASWKLAGDGRHTWGELFPEAGWTVTVMADHADVVGCLAWELTMIRTADAPPGLTLKGWAAGIAARASGLREDLKLIEVDETRDEALLRSDEPSKRGAVAGYYEVRLSGRAKAVVRRFQADTAAGTPREQVAFALTHEVLAQLAEDIAAAGV